MTEYDEHQEHEHGAEFADFDAFFAEQPEPERTGPPFRLYGREWRLPERLGGMFAMLVQRMQASNDPADVRTLIGYLFGRDALDTFIANGMEDAQFSTLLLWATANVRQPGSLSIADADAARRRQEAAKGKAGKPRPKGKKGRPRSSGARS